MRLNNKGEVTIPAELRARLNLHEGDEVDVIEEGGALRTRPVSWPARRTRGTGRVGVPSVRRSPTSTSARTQRSAATVC
ncbi:AbrB/MazE/SpoVT family DNA-binding domain-containing protein [Micromonospora aurantiaca]|nr:AbrB/MazE/SpoVT family DNA-binding domain-containing protein [Micromonospora aurantiaca]